MTSIHVTVCQEQATAVKTGRLTVGMVGVSVTFSFDEQWEGLKRIAVFRSGDISRDRALLLSDTTTVPFEVLYKPEERLMVGVEGRTEDGTLVIPTTWADAGVVLDGANASGDYGKDPSPNAYDDIMAAIRSGALQGPQGPKGDKGDPAEVPPRDITTGKLSPAEKGKFANLMPHKWLLSYLRQESDNLSGFAAWAYRNANVDVYSHLDTVHSVFKRMFDTANKASNGYKYKLLEETEENEAYFAMLVPGSYGGGTAMSSHGYEYTMTEEDYQIGDIFCGRYVKTLDNGTTTDKGYYMAVYMGQEENGVYLRRNFLIYLDYGEGVDLEGSAYISEYSDLCAFMGADSEFGTPVYYYVLRPENLAALDVRRVEKSVDALQQTDADMKNLSKANVNYYGALPVSRGGTGAGTAANALKNLGAMTDKLVHESITITPTSKSLDEHIDDFLSGMSSGTNRFVNVVNSKGDKEQFSLKAGGNRWMLLITKITSNYARVLAWCTSTCWIRSKSNGEWSE